MSINVHLLEGAKNQLIKCLVYILCDDIDKKSFGSISA